MVQYGCVENERGYEYSTRGKEERGYMGNQFSIANSCPYNSYISTMCLK